MDRYISISIIIVIYKKHVSAQAYTNVMMMTEKRDVEERRKRETEKRQTQKRNGEERRRREDGEGGRQRRDGG